MINYIIIFLLAIVASTASVMVGLGGGLLMIPLIILVFGLPMKYVAGTMLFAMVPYTLVSILRNRQGGYISFKIGLVMEVGSVMGVLVGSHTSALLPNVALKIIFFLVVLYLMITLRIPQDSPYNYVAILFKFFNRFPPKFRFRLPDGEKRRLGLFALISVGFVAGFFSGLLGIGGGFLKTPVLLVGVMLPPKMAVGTSLFMIFITASVGAITHGLMGQIHYTLALVISAGMIIGALVGTGIFRKIPERRVKTYIFLAMLVAALLVFFR